MAEPVRDPGRDLARGADVDGDVDALVDGVAHLGEEEQRPGHEGAVQGEHERPANQLAPEPKLQLRPQQLCPRCWSGQGQALVSCVLQGRCVVQGRALGWVLRLSGSSLLLVLVLLLVLFVMLVLMLVLLSVLMLVLVLVKVLVLVSPAQCAMVCRRVDKRACVLCRAVAVDSAASAERPLRLTSSSSTSRGGGGGGDDEGDEGDEEHGRGRA